MRRSVPNTIRGAYETFFEAFRKAGNMDNVSVSFSTLPLPDCFTDSGSKATVEFNRCVYLKDLRCQRLPGSKRLHVVIRVREEIIKVNGEWLLAHSTVYLNYFVVSNSTALLAQSLHYDFKDGGQPNHPFFHVELTDELIPVEHIRSTGFDLELKLPEQQVECWVTTRIPTPDMSFTSVLYSLAADHLQPHIFKQFAEDVESIIQKQIPRPAFDQLRESLKMNSLHFKSPHWFAHMQ